MAEWIGLLRAMLVLLGPSQGLERMGFGKAERLCHWGAARALESSMICQGVIVSTAGSISSMMKL